MMTETIEYHVTTNKLIEICLDSQRLFATASKSLESREPLLKAELMQYSNQWADFAIDMEHELSRLGEQPSHHGTLGGAMHRGWMSVKQAMSADERSAVLTECLRSEKAALQAYRDSLYADLPPILENLAQTQCVAIERVRNRIQALCDAATPRVN